MNQELTQAIKVIQSRQKSFPGLSYPIAAGQFGQDIVVPEAIDCDESRMSIWIPFADGNNRDGVGDVLEIGGIRTDRHQPNPFVLYDHGKQISLPVAMSEDPDTKQYTVVLDTTSRRGKGNAFFYQGTGMSHALRGEEYEHGHFCHQLYDLMVKGYVRGGSIGYTVIAARELPADYQMGTPKGLHLLSTKMLEYSSVVLPANQDTVIAKHKGLEWYMDRMADQAREILCMRSVCGKPLPGHFIKSLSAYAGAVPTKLSKMAVDPRVQPGSRVIVRPSEQAAQTMIDQGNANVSDAGPKAIRDRMTRRGEMVGNAGPRAQVRMDHPNGPVTLDVDTEMADITPEKGMRREVTDKRMKGLRKKYRVKSQTDDVRETGTRQAQVGERVHVDDRYARRTDGPRNPLNRGEATARFEDTLGGGRVDYRTDVEGREEAAANEAILKDESGSPLGPQVTRDPSSIRRDHPKSLNRGVKMAISPNVQVGSRVRSRPTRQNAEAMVEGTSQHPLDYMNRHTNHGVASQVGTVDGDVPFVRISRENDSDLHAYDDYDDVDVLPGKALQGGVQPGKALQGGVQPGSRVQVRPNYATAEDMAEEDVHLPVGGQARYLTTAEVTQMNTREGEYDGDAMNGSHVVRSDVLDGVGRRRRENYPADQYDLRPPPKKGMARKAGDPNSSGQGNNINPEWVNELHQSPGGGYELHSTRVAEGPNDLGLTFIEGPYDTYDRAVQEHEHENESGPDHGYTPRVHLIDRTQKGVYLNTQAVGQLKALVGALAQLAGYKTADGPITDKRVVDAQLNWDTAPVTVREVSDDLGLSHPDRALSIDHAYNLRDARNFGEDPPQSPVEDSHAQRSRVQAESGFVPHSQRTGSKATRKEIVDSMADKNTGAGQVLAEVNRFDLPVQDEFESISRGSQVSSARKEGREPPESPYEDDAARAARIQGTPKKDLRSKYRKKSMGTKVTDKRGVDTRTHKPNVSTYSPGFLTDTGYKQVVEEENDLDSQQRDANGRMFNGNEIYIDAASDRVNRGGAFRNSEDVPRTDDDEKDWLGKAVDRRAGMNRNRQATGVSVDATDAQRRQTQAQVGTHLSTDQQARQSTPGQYPEEPNPGTQDPAALERAAQIEQRRQQWQERDRAARGEKSKRVKMALDPNVKPGDRVRVRPTLQQAQNRLQAGQTAPKGKESTAEILRDEDTRYGVVGQIRNFGYPDVHQVVQFRNEAGGKEEKRPAFSDLEDIDPAPKKGLEKAQAVRVDRLSQQDAENARRGGVAGNEIGRSMVTTEDEHGQRTQRLIGDANARIDAQAFDNQLSGHGVHTGIRPQGPQHDVQPGQQSIPRVIGPGKIALKPQARQELQQAGVDLSKSQKSVSRKRYSLKNSQPGTSLVWVARKDLGPAMSEAVTLGLKAIVRDDGQKTVRLKVSGEDATIDKLAKKYGRPINLQGR